MYLWSVFLSTLLSYSLVPLKTLFNLLFTFVKEKVETVQCLEIRVYLRPAHGHNLPIPRPSHLFTPGGVTFV